MSILKQDAFPVYILASYICNIDNNSYQAYRIFMKGNLINVSTVLWEHLDRFSVLLWLLCVPKHKKDLILTVAGQQLVARVEENFSLTQINPVPVIVPHIGQSYPRLGVYIVCLLLQCAGLNVLSVYIPG